MYNGYGYYSTQTLNINSIFEMFLGFGMPFYIASFAVSIFEIICVANVLKKCGKPGWSIIVPFYNFWVILEAGGLPGWLSLLPVANVVGLIVAWFKIPKKLGKNTGFSIGLFFFSWIFIPILAFDKSVVVKEEINKDTPDFMADDPMAGDSINLMASAPETITSIEESKPLGVENTTDMLSLNTNEQLPISDINAFVDEPLKDVNVIEQIPVLDEEIPKHLEMSETPNLLVEEPAIDSVQIPELLFNDPTVQDNHENDVVQYNENFENTIRLDQISSPEMPTMEIPVLANNAQDSKCPGCGFENKTEAIACEMCGKLL